MTREQIQKEIKEMDAWIPVSKIEEKLGMPPTTLQKVLKGTRPLPKKWTKILEAYFIKSDQTDDNNNQPEKHNEEVGFNFGNESILFLEKYTKYPLKDKPISALQYHVWSREKTESDQGIKIAFGQHLKKLLKK